MTIKYNLVSLGDKENLTAFINGEMYVASQDHQNWVEIVAGVRAQDESVSRLFDPQTEINEKFLRLTDRVSLKGGRVYFDNEVTDDVLAEQISLFYENDNDFMPLVNFMEKVATNPNAHSREQLYKWLRNKDFVITPDGDIVAYKGVNRNSEHEGFDYSSCNSGTAIVDGETYTGHIPQSIGSVVEMPRSEVQHNPSTGCSTGLHVGTHSFATGYGNVLIRVVINPRDVVSVPTECGAAKMRVCRYVVIEEESSRIEVPVYSAPVVEAADDDADNWGEDDEEECYCGEWDCTGDSDCRNYAY